MATDSTDQGFILPAIVVALTVLYLTAGVGYTVSALEARMSEAQAASVRAFYLADAAVSDALATFGDSVSSRSYDFGEGGAFVEVSTLLDAPDGVRLLRFTATARVDLRRGGPSVRRVESVALVAAGEDSTPPMPVAVPGTWRESMDW
jgi:hypothetical protein